MSRIRFFSARWAIAAAIALAGAPSLVLASSHSEAPGTAKDRLADDTDLYAFVTPRRAERVTFVGNWVPLLEPNGGPNFYSFDDQAAYYINIDNVGRLPRPHPVRVQVHDHAPDRSHVPLQHRGRDLARPIPT